jgi:alkanesulfonate monooxygenase SsuD/methylene tetrahydromethanopterin reductase-like flavin-dependent oxidoreductase (luciferase family)
VLRKHCEQASRDPGEIHVSTQGVLYLSTDEQWLRDNRPAGPAPAIVGTPSEVTDIIGRYQEAGADEIIVPDSNLGPLEAKLDTIDLFMTEVAAAFR